MISDRWNGFSGEHGLTLTGRVFAAWCAYQHEHHDRHTLQREIASIQTELRRLLKDASPTKAQSLAPGVREQPGQGLARALDVHHYRWGTADQRGRLGRQSRSRIATFRCEGRRDLSTIETTRG